MKKCEAAYPVIADDGEHSSYFACTKKGKHVVHVAEWTIYDNSYMSPGASLVLKWRERP